MNRIYFLFFLLLLFAPGRLLSQSGEDCKRLLRKADSALQHDSLREALTELRALKICDPSLNAIADEKILAVYNRIRAQKDTAVAAEGRAQAATRAARTARNEAIRQKDTAESRLKTLVSEKLSTAARNLQKGEYPDWEKSLLLATEAIHLYPSLEGYQALKNAVDHLPILVKTLPPNDGITQPFQSPNKKFIAAQNDSKIKLWEAENLKPLTMTFNTDLPWLFTPLKDNLVIDTGSNRVSVIELPSGKILHSFYHQYASATPLAVSDDDRFLATTDYVVTAKGELVSENKIHIWDIDSEKDIVDIIPHDSIGEGDIHAWFSRLNGKPVFVAGNATLQYWPVDPAKKDTAAVTIEGALTSDGNFKYKQFSDSDYAIYNLLDDTPLIEIHEKLYRPEFKLSKDGRYLLACPYYFVFEMWDVKQNKKLYTKYGLNRKSEPKKNIHGIIFSDNDKYFSWRTSSTVWDVQTGEPVVTNFWSEGPSYEPMDDQHAEEFAALTDISRDNPAYYQFFSGTGDTAYSLTGLGEFMQWIIRPANFIAHADPALFTAVKNEDSALVAAIVKKLGIPGNIDGHDISNDRKYLVLGTSGINKGDNGLWFIDLENKTGKKIDSSLEFYYQSYFWKGTDWILLSAAKNAITADYGLYLMNLKKDSISFDIYFRPWDRFTFNKANTLIAADLAGAVSLFSIDSRNKATLLHIKEFKGIQSLEFSPAGNELLVVSKPEDNSTELITIWDFGTNTVPAVISAKSDFKWAQFTSDNRNNILIATGNQVDIYDWRTEGLLKDAARRTTRPLTKEEWAAYAGKDIPFLLKNDTKK